MRQFTRAEVAALDPITSPHIILADKVYDMTAWLADHPGGEAAILEKAGTDATADFEALAHSEAAREQAKTFVVGEIVASERRSSSSTASAATHTSSSSSSSSSTSGGSGLTLGRLASAALLLLYGRSTVNARPIASDFTYSALLRHNHLLMAIGLFGCIASVHLSRRTEDAAEKGAWMRLHKSGGVLMLLALIVRLVARMRSAIPPRFPGPAALKVAETASHRLFYVLCGGSALSGLSMGYFGGKGVPFFGSTLIVGKSSPSEEDVKKAKASFSTHLVLGKIIEYFFIPFHFGGNALHWMQGSDVFRKISPFV